MELIPIKYLVIGMVVIFIPFVLYLLLWSTPASHLESKFIEKAEFDVEQVNQVPLTGGGLALAAGDATGNALMQVYAKVPLLNRYMATDEFDFTDEGDPINFNVRVWAGHAGLTWDQGLATSTGKRDGDGWGVGGSTLFKLLQWELIFAAFVLIRNDVIKTRREKAANPVKNY
jgi:hypothetical protein